MNNFTIHVCEGMYIYTSVCVCMCVCVCMYVCMYACVCERERGFGVNYVPTNTILMNL